MSALHLKTFSHDDGADPGIRGGFCLQCQQLKSMPGQVMEILSGMEVCHSKRHKH